MERQIKAFVEETLRPLLQGDGGEIEYDGFSGGRVFVTLRGECARCPVEERCMDWCEAKLREACGAGLRMEARKKPPYFWDT